VPLLLVAPIALAGAPTAHAAAVYSVLFVLFGVFGSAIPLVRDGASGLLTRWHLAGMPARELIGSRIAAQTVLDFIEALPATAFILVAGSRGAGGGSAASALLLALPFTLLVANAIGAWAAALARSLAEAALFASVLSLLLLHAAGTFRTPDAGSPGAVLERFSPFRTLHEAFLGAAGGGTVDGAGWTPALLGGAALLLATAAMGPFLIGRVSRSQD
jgi:hypothetical protein